MELTPTSSFWASTDPEELRSGEAASAGLVQTVTLSAPPCSGGLERPTSYPGQLPGDDVDRARRVGRTRLGAGWQRAVRKELKRLIRCCAWSVKDVVNTSSYALKAP